MRAMFNRDIATGLLPVWNELTTFGPSSTFHIKNEVPEAPEPRCYILKRGSCTTEQFETVKNGTAIIKDFFVTGTVEEDRSWEGVDQKQHIFSEDK